MEGQPQRMTLNASETHWQQWTEWTQVLSWFEVADHTLLHRVGPEVFGKLGRGRCIGFKHPLVCVTGHL